MVILLHGIDDALPGGEIDRAASRDGIRSRPALGRMFTFAFDSDFLRSKHVQLPLRIGLLINFSAFSRGRYGISDRCL